MHTAPNTPSDTDTELQKMASVELNLIEKAGPQFAEHVSRILIDSEKSRQIRHEIIIDEYNKFMNK